MSDEEEQVNVVQNGGGDVDPAVLDGEAHRTAVEDVTTATLRQVTLLLHNVTDKNKELENRMQLNATVLNETRAQSTAASLEMTQDAGSPGPDQPDVRSRYPNDREQRPPRQAGSGGLGGSSRAGRATSTYAQCHKSKRRKHPA